MTGKVALEGLEFHAFHGVYDHERDTGNKFEVDITVETDFSKAAQHDELKGTVDYEILFRIVQEEMQIPSKLIETVAEKIIERVLNELPAVLQAELKIAKLEPPIGGKCRKAWVKIMKKR